MTEGKKQKKGDVSFTGLLGNSPRVKLWEFLLLGRNFEYNIKDLAAGAGVSRPTCYAELKGLLRKGVVVKGTKYRGKQLYKFNKKSPVANAMLVAFQQLLHRG